MGLTSFYTITNPPKYLLSLSQFYEKKQAAVSSNKKNIKNIWALRLWAEDIEWAPTRCTEPVISSFNLMLDEPEINPNFYYKKNLHIYREEINKLEPRKMQIF